MNKNGTTPLDALDRNMDRILSEVRFSLSFFKLQSNCQYPHFIMLI